jgi:GTP-binding protein
VLVPPGTVVSGLEGRGFDLVEPGQRAVVARGGLGGHGNKRFASSTRQTPRFAERGLEGESGWIELRLRLLADAGLVGLPNAGKSSLLRRLTRAAPKVADYPFTTTEPVLGTIAMEDRQLVLADIPGLIEGAAEGAGLGHEFLAHVERCRLLVHLVAVDPHEERDPDSAYETIRAELAAHGAGLENLPEIVVISKRDLAPAEQVERVIEGLRGRVAPGPEDVLAISSVTGEGLEELTRMIFDLVPESPGGEAVAAAEPEPEFEAEHITYRPDAEQGFAVEREEGAYRVRGRGVELLVARHDLANEEALGYLEQRLREIGVIAALERAGFSPGDEVRIGDEVFELDPG